MDKERTRDSNFELLRIICMLMIVVLHYMGKGGALANTAPSEVNFYISHFAEALSIVAVNCYIMISGYFMITSEFRLRKLAALWLQVLFYSIGIYLFILFTGLEDFSVKMLVTVAFPVLLKEYWFISGYMALLLLSPFLNIAIKALSKYQLEKLILILIGLLVVWGNMVPQGFLFINNGYSLTQFVFVYIVAAYIRLYWDTKINKYFYLTGYFACAFLIGSMSIPLFKIGKIRWWDANMLDYSFLFVFIGALCLFMFIREVKISSEFINRIAPLTLGVYLIHEQLSLKKYLYSTILSTQNYYHSGWFALHALISVLSVFIISICIDAARKKLFDAVTLLATKTYNLISRPVG